MTESAFVKDTDFIRASLFTSSRIVKNLNQHIVKSPDKQRLKKLSARRSNIWANLWKIDDYSLLALWTILFRRTQIARLHFILTIEISDINCELTPSFNMETSGFLRENRPRSADFLKKSRVCFDRFPLGFCILEPVYPKFRPPSGGQFLINSSNNNFYNFETLFYRWKHHCCDDFHKETRFSGDWISKIFACGGQNI